jgi:hypothetical protein
MSLLMRYPNYKCIPKSKPLHPANINNDNINNEVNDSHLKIPIDSIIINIEHDDLWFDFVIQSCNVLNQKLQTFKDEIFTKFS